MPGRKMQPVEIIQARGRKHLTKDEFAARRAAEPDAPEDLRGARPPEWLCRRPELLKRFTEYANALSRVVPGLFCQLDAELLAQHVVWEEQFEQLASIANGVKDVDELSRLQQMMHKAYIDSKSSASAMGLTLTDRCRLSVPAPAGGGVQDDYKV